MGAFSVSELVTADGALDATRLSSSGAAAAKDAQATLEPRLERVACQQYARFHTVRRDVEYAMCGSTGTVVLSGSSLAAARTPESLRPVRTRLVVWAGLTLVGAVLVHATGRGLVGEGEYLARVRAWIDVLSVTAIALLVPSVGGVLRSFRPGPSLVPLRAWERRMAVLAGVAVLAVVAVSFSFRPRVGDIEGALGRGDVQRARLVLDALSESSSARPSLRDAADAVALAESRTMSRDDRLRTLDAVASGSGAHAAEAASLARAERLQALGAMLDTGAAQAVTPTMDEWYPSGWRNDPELKELRARAFDRAADGCGDDACRALATSRAVDANGTEERKRRSSDARATLMAALSPAELTGGPSVDRWQRLRSLVPLARTALDLPDGDEPIARRAHELISAEQSARAKIPLMGATLLVVEGVFGVPADRGGKFASFALFGTSVFVVTDSSDRCRGLYAVGARSGSRGIAGSDWTAERIASQAFGHEVRLQPPRVDSVVVTRGSESGVPIAVRWKSRTVVELRIGDGSP